MTYWFPHPISISLQPAPGVPRSLAADMGNVMVKAHVGALVFACVRLATAVPFVQSVGMATMKLLAMTATWYVRVCRVFVLGWAGEGRGIAIL